jgi:nucleoside-diphosphate-sugar epimerase
MRALVTGASGFTGRHIVEKLVAGNHTVRCLVRRTSNIEPLKRMGVEICFGDLADGESLKRAAHSVDVLFHTAAHVGDWGTRRQFYEGNVVGTRNVLEAALVGGVKKLLYISSVAVYGRQQGVVNEEAPRQKNGDPYVDTKIEAETLVLDYARQHGLAVSVLRPCVIYGPYDFKFLPRLAQNILQGKMMVIGSGENRAPLVYVEDVADLSLLAAEREEATGEIFNAASGESITWNQLLVQVASALKAKPPKLHLPFPLVYYSGAVMEVLWRLARAQKPPLITRFATTLLGGDYCYQMTKAERVLGFRPKVMFRQGLENTIQWMRGQGLC